MLLKWYVKATTLAVSDEGATAVEYGIMVAGIAVVIMATVWLLGGEIKTLFETVITKLKG
ncbi:MAG: Flp family type IVb pilin [Coriobacteriia bacterium]|nr:Flp family type IVb pilin [Coriobacteriia bacterium]